MNSSARSTKRLCNLPEEVAATSAAHYLALEKSKCKSPTNFSSSHKYIPALSPMEVFVQSVKVLFEATS